MWGDNASGAVHPMEIVLPCAVAMVACGDNWTLVLTSMFAFDTFVVEIITNFLPLAILQLSPKALGDRVVKVGAGMMNFGAVLTSTILLL
jgi:hypothetical protein